MEPRKLTPHSQPQIHTSPEGIGISLGFTDGGGGGGDRGLKIRISKSLWWPSSRPLRPPKTVEPESGPTSSEPIQKHENRNIPKLGDLNLALPSAYAPPGKIHW